ncbi:MAG TPA: ADP-glyceromanno-heptose 6-epimerase [Verrucomicrobiae bacterium]|nr:ADP-glyceromanno-heptose 6-epimerase [Verrucomicrobiae bacterium]
MGKEWAEKRVLVTGGAGFIGSAVVWQLNRLGCDNIVVTDFLGTGDKWMNLRALGFSDYLEADEFLDRVRSRPSAFGKFDTVIHLGACSSTTERDAAYLARNNYGYTRDLGAWALGREARFVYASSAATYGDGSAGMEDGQEGLGRLRPLNMYGYSKHLYDMHAWRHGLLRRIAGLKYFNVYGPNEGHKGDMRSVVAGGFEQIRAAGRMRLFKSYRAEYRDGEQARDFLYVKDAAAMTVHLAGKGRANGLFNLGSGTARTWLDLARAIFSTLGRKPEIDFVEMPETIRDRYQYFTRADISRLRASGFRAPITTLEDSVADYVGNYLVPGRHLGEEDA